MAGSQMEQRWYRSGGPDGRGGRGEQEVQMAALWDGDSKRRVAGGRTSRWVQPVAGLGIGAVRGQMEAARAR